MDLGKILEDFNRTKDKIRKGTPYKTPSSNHLDGLSMAIDYSEIMEYVTKSLFELTAEYFGTKNVQGIAAFLYGSPGRREMVCESDLDVMLIHRDNSLFYSKFKQQFKQFAKPFEFCKIDIPEWGSLEEASLFAERSITEGNQVLDCRYVGGDLEIDKKIKEIQEKFGNEDRMLRNIIFQKFYFEQYFRQRTRGKDINVKYCHGGSRDYLFIHWFDQLMSRKQRNWDKSLKGRPWAEKGLFNMYQNGLISTLEFTQAIDALHFNLLLRNEILLANKGTQDEGLTFLDQKTLFTVYSRLPRLMEEYLIKSPQQLAEQFDTQRRRISAIKDRIWNLMIDEKVQSLDNLSWGEDFREAYSEETFEENRRKFLTSDDLLTRIAIIWGASNSHQRKLLKDISMKEKDSNSWEIQASLATSPYCPSEHLHHIAEGIGKEKGYGYILRIISRNPQVKKRTLRLIVENPNLEFRYIQCAKAALEGGNESANHQV